MHQADAACADRNRLVVCPWASKIQTHELDSPSLNTHQAALRQRWDGTWKLGKSTTIVTTIWCANSSANHHAALQQAHATTPFAEAKYVLRSQTSL